MGADWPKRYEKWISGDNNWGPIKCYFNSALSHEGVTPGSNATLTIYLRLYLVERNAKDAHLIRSSKADKDIVRDWAPGEFREFKDAVKTKCEAFWNKRLTLVNNRYDVSTFDKKVGSDTVRPNIDCCFEIVWAESPASAHQMINCFCPNPGKDFASFVRGSDTGDGVGQFAHKLAIVENRPTPFQVTCTRDVGDPLKPLELKKQPYACPQMVDHLGVAHEIGHLLGLPHVGVARRSHDCLQAMAQKPAEGGNADICYVGNGPRDASNIMGMGNEIHEWNAMPWAIRMFKHTGIGPATWGVAVDEKKLPKLLRAA
jgi:hypothetical protein